MIRYRAGARFYDVASGERPVYRPGRLIAIDQLRLHPGEKVLDVGCGTGLNLPLLIEATGPSGTVVGVDASPSMPARARARTAAHDWRDVTLIRADAAHLDQAVPEGMFDAALFTYSLSIIDGWRSAWAQALARVRPGGRVAVVDMARPTGAWRLLTPLALLACRTGGADIDRAPWTVLLETTTQPTHTVVRGGHVHVAVGCKP